MRLINADDFLDLFYVASAGQDKRFRQVVEMVVEDVPTVDAEPKWTSVEDRLPEIYHTYLVALKEKHSFETEWERHVDVALLVDSGGYIDDRWDTFFDWKEGQDVHVTHWMPLPDLPKMDLKEE